MTRLCLCLLMLLTGPGHAQPFHFRHYGIAQGLSNSNVEVIAQDRAGFLWIGTQSGLNRFDGYAFRAFKSRFRDTTCISDNWITAIHTDRRGRFWIATRDGLSLYHPQTETFTQCRPPGLRDFFITGLMEDSLGQFLLSSNKGVWRFDADRQRFQRYPTGRPDSSYSYSGISRDASGNLLLGSTGGLWISRCDRMEQVHIAPYRTLGMNSDMVIRTAIIRDTTYLLTWGKGLIRFEAGKGMLRHWHQLSNPSALSNDIVKSLIPSKGLGMLAGTFGGGVDVLDSAGNVTAIVRHQPGDAASLASDFVNILFEDRQGLLWVGTDQGLDQYDPLPAGMMQSHALQGKNAPSGLNDVAETAPCIFFLASYDGLCSWDQQTGQTYALDDALGLGRYDGAFSLLQEGPVLWVGCAGKVYRLLIDGTHIIAAKRCDLPVGSVVSCLYRDPTLGLLLGLYGGGVYRLDDALGKAEPLQLPGGRVQNLDRISAILRDTKERLWLASNGAGIACYDPAGNTWTHFHPDSSASPFPDPIIICLREGANGRVWAGTLSYGLVSLDADSNRFHIHDQHAGFPATRVDACVADAHGLLWMLTDRGLVSFDPGNGLSRLYSGAGFPEPNIYLSTLSKGRNSRIWIGDKQRLLSFDPTAMNPGSEAPETILTGFRIFDTPQPLNGKATLSYDQNYFTFDFTGLDFRQTERLRYEYRMEGIDRHWIDARDRRVAAYSNLAAGRYTFVVRAVNADGVPDATPATVSIRILPPFWQRWWFYLAGLALTAALLYLAYRIRIGRLLALQRVRNRIAQDLHDDVGSTLSSISILSSMAATQLHSDRAESLVRKISDSSQTMVQNMRDLVWAVNPAHDSMDDMLSYMRQYLAATLEPQDIAFSLEAEPAVIQRRLSAEQRRGLYLIYKEAVNNAAKYAQCSRVTIRLWLERKALHLEVCDNGRGFDAGQASTGNGLRNMQSRAGALGGKLTITSGKSGSCIQLSMPLS